MKTRMRLDVSKMLNLTSFIGFKPLFLSASPLTYCNAT